MPSDRVAGLTGISHGERAPAPVRHRVCTVVESVSDEIGPACSGTIVHGWVTFVPGPAEFLVAQPMADRAVAAISRARVADQAQQALAAVGNLRIALQTNRRIGIAVGILMALRKTTDAAAFDLLAKASQHANRKLRDVADEVIEFGCLPKA